MSEDYTIADCFHDRHVVLKEVTKWHEIMRRMARRDDHITALVFDLVDQHLLVPDDERLSATELKNALVEIVTQIRGQPSVPMPDELILAMHDMNAKASHNYMKSTASAWEEMGLQTARDRTAQKSIVAKMPIRRTAHRAQYLRSVLPGDTSHSGSNGSNGLTRGLSVASGSARPSTTPVPRATPTRQSTFGNLASAQQVPQYMEFSALSRQSTLSSLASAQQNVQILPSKKEASRQSRSSTLTSAQQSPGLTDRFATFQQENSVDRRHEPQDVFQAREQLQSAKKWYKRSKEDYILSQYIVNRDIVGISLRFFD